MGNCARLEIIAPSTIFARKYAKLRNDFIDLDEIMVEREGESSTCLHQ